MTSQMSCATMFGGSKRAKIGIGTGWSQSGGSKYEDPCSIKMTVDPVPASKVLEKVNLKARLKRLSKCGCSDVPCLSVFKEYCEASSLHGLRYITEDGRHWIERALWILVCVLGFILTVYFVVPLYIRWSKQPTLTTLESMNYPVSEIDFPGVTFCSDNKVDQNKLIKLAEEPKWKKALDTINKGGLTAPKGLKLLEELLGFVAMQTSSSNAFIEQSSFQSPSESSKRLFQLVGYPDIMEAMRKVAPGCSELVRCWWNGKIFNCSDIFDVRKTDHGFCCSFNTLKESENFDLSSLELKANLIQKTEGADLDSGATSNRTKRSFEDQFFHSTNQDILDIFDQLIPGTGKGHNGSVAIGGGSKDWHGPNRVRRLGSAGFLHGLSVLLSSGLTENSVANEGYPSLRVLVHGPGAFPELSNKGLVIASGTENFISVTASYTQGSASIRDFPVDLRNCLFEDERNVAGSEVEFFKVYNEENCLLECRAKNFLERCGGCLPYFYPRVDLLIGHDEEATTFTTNATSAPLVDQQQNRESPETTSNFGSKCSWESLICLKNPSGDENNLLGDENGHPEDQCNCPSSCTRTTYQAALSAAKLRQKSLTAVGNGTLVHVYYSDLKMLKYSTSQLYTWQEILANFGGLVGLCSGFSFLSVVEIVYFFTLRLYLQLFRKRHPREQLDATDDVLGIGD